MGSDTRSTLEPLKEDLLMAGEVAGLLGRALCVRRSALPLQAQEFAASRRIAVIQKDHLIRGLSAELNPDQPGSLARLRTIASARAR